MMSPTSLSFLSGDRSTSGLDSVLTEYMEADSPASFPSTPFSRARVMNRCYERVDSLMFAARDKLRLEAQSASRDAYSRSAALKARTHGQYAVFDSKQASDGLALTCGNHCAMKVGKGLCCSCRAMMPIPVNTLVYLEFSITTSGTQIPSISVGLGPPDAPLNVMVGSWPCSVGLYSDGQLLIDSRWFQSVSNNDGSLNAGTTVGFLIYIPDSSIPKRLSEGHLESDQDSNEKDSNSNSNSLTPSSSFSTAIVALLGNGSTKTSDTPTFTRTTSKSSVTKTTPTTLKSINIAPSTPNLLDANATEGSKPLFPNSVLSLLGFSDQANENRTENTPTRKGISGTNSTSLLNFFQNSKSSQEKGSPSDKSESSNNKFEETLVGVCDLAGVNELVSSRIKDKKTADKKLPFTMVMHVNGIRREYSQQAMEAAKDIVTLQAPLYPTVSLISENTRVWCRYYY